ncbi:PAS domain S-box-containing protein [Luteibacter jiangsuensis]|uniref:histidine kinase n=1 Tax=Luteibacter jiangsuensis TaxID=637577 RepID=A0ABT9T3N4_9GAMM|nr:ATP-binding protein [Luteibacter jiangsuensis]MDQ0011590.1 PAS domain S-box-containing protein [Luteibacter jiangsuensis]
MSSLPMSRYTPLQSRAYAPAARPRRLVAGLLMGFGALLALGVFLVDTFTPLQSAVAVVYVVVVLLVAASGSRRAIVGAAAGCMVLTAVAYLRGHGWIAFDAAMMRCTVSLGAIAITAVLALRNRDRMITIAGQASLIELTHDSIFVRDMDDIIVLWNGGAEQLYGWTAHEALGRRANDLLGTAFPGDRKAADAELSGTGRWEGEVIQRHRDGRIVIVEARCALLRDEQGKPRVILEAGTDVTERRAAAAATAESERRYRSMFETARFSFWEEDYSRVMERVATLREEGVTDLAAYLEAHPEFVTEACELTCVTDVNEAAVRMLGARRREDLIGPLSRFLPASERTFAQVLLTIIQGGGIAEGETHLVNLRGERITVLFGLNMPLGPSRYDRVLVSVVDITDRKRAERALIAVQAELAQAARVTALGEMSASIAHEVNQPLAAIVTHGEAALRWLRRPEPDLGEACDAIERVVRDARRASEVVHRVRSLASKEPRQHVPFDLAALIEECAQLLDGEIALHRIVLRVDIARDAPTPRGDRVQLQQVVVNLMGNAIRAMSAVCGQRRLLVRARPEGANSLLVEVEDSGTGIPEHIAPHLFDAFVTTRGDGMGMGLAICRSTIESHGGRLWATNRPEGGATFHFTLPVTVAEELRA